MNSSNARAAVVSMLHQVDQRDWPAVRHSFADRVVAEYSSLSGSPAAEPATGDRSRQEGKAAVPIFANSRAVRSSAPERHGR
jgi:hypothetical protein